MKDTHIYRIQLEGQIIAEEINALSPLEMAVIRVSIGKTTFSARTDQSGLMGLLRHLHSRGLVLLSVVRRPQKNLSGAEHVS